MATELVWDLLAEDHASAALDAVAAAADRAADAMNRLNAALDVLSKATKRDDIRTDEE